MAKFAYQLTFSASNPSPTAIQAHLFIAQNRDIETWYLPFSGTYIFKSDKLLTELQVQFGQFFGQSLFILSYLSPNLVGGSLPQNIWQWLNQLDTQLLS
jgi:hypothetical protein